MRLFVFPLVTLGVLVSGFSDEPSEGQMKRAFETSLSAQVRDVMSFVTEAGGPQAVEKIQQVGSDRFAVRTFRKGDCARVDTEHGYLCTFKVDIELANGSIERRMSGRFSPSPSGLAYLEGV